MIKIPSQIIDLTPAIIISMMGGFANYIYKTSKGEKFHIVKMASNIFLAGFLGYIVQAFIPQDNQMFGPLLAISGFCSYPILQLLESNGSNIIGKFMK